MAALFRHPIFGLLTYVATFYLHPPSRWWGETLPDIRWSLTAGAVTLLAVLIRPQLMRQRPVFSRGPIIGLSLFLVWLVIQSIWALAPDLHWELTLAYVKYVILIAIIVWSIETERHLSWFLWTHVLGCLFLGWIAFSEYQGGRFEGFGGPDIGEANAGALQIVTGIFAAAALFLAGNWWQRLGLVGSMPFIVNALIVTVSRSGSLALVAGGLVFNWFTPPRFRWFVRSLSVLAIVLFALLTNDVYWERLSTLLFKGEEVAGVDTGQGRLVLMEAQGRMFSAYPFGCGHRCTAVLSPMYLDDMYLSGPAESRGRASHNTFMSLLVEQGVVGAGFYIVSLIWIARALGRARQRAEGQGGLLSTFVPSLAAAFAAIVVGDMFVDYLKIEVRIWFIAMLVLMSSWELIPQSPRLREPSDRTAASSRLRRSGGMPRNR